MFIVVRPLFRVKWLSKARTVSALSYPKSVIQGRQMGQQSVKILAAAGIGLAPKPATDDDVHRNPKRRLMESRVAGRQDCRYAVAAAVLAHSTVRRRPSRRSTSASHPNSFPALEQSNQVARTSPAWTGEMAGFAAVPGQIREQPVEGVDIGREACAYIVGASQFTGESENVSPGDIVNVDEVALLAAVAGYVSGLIGQHCAGKYGNDASLAFGILAGTVDVGVAQDYVG